MCQATGVSDSQICSRQTECTCTRRFALKEGADHTEWTLYRGTLSQIIHFQEVPHTDLFATKLNNQLPTFVSPFRDGIAWAVDAISLSWERMLAYAFPPISLLLKVLLKIEKETKSCLVILIAPCWESCPCFPVLLSLLVAPLIKLSYQWIF